MNSSGTYRIKGMHCASCASIIEKTLKKIQGVNSIEVNFGTEAAKLSFDEKQVNVKDLSKKIEPLGYSFSLEEDHLKHKMSSMKNMSGEDHSQHSGIGQSRTEKLVEIQDMRGKILWAIPIAIFSSLVMAWEIFSQSGFLPFIPYLWEEFFHHLMPLFATYILFVVGKPYLFGFYRFLRYGKANMDSLIGMGTLVAFIYSFVVTAFQEPLSSFINTENVYYDVTIIVITFITLGKYLEARSKLRTGDAIQQLMKLQAKTALVIREGKEQEINIEDVIKGDIVVVKPAGKIPVDGIIEEGSSYIDESMVTGESMPVDKKPGDSVISGTINTSGSFMFKATNVGSETMLAHIIQMVEEAQGTKAPIQGLADKISGVFVPFVMAFAFITLGLWLLTGAQYFGFSEALSLGLVSFVSILVIACPCALGLATPTAIIVGVGKGAGEGILIKDAATLEKLHNVNVLLADKTATITKGKPELVSMKNLSDSSDKDLVSILASLEKKSEHPIAHAIVFYASEKEIPLLSVGNFETLKGKGIKGVIDGKEYYAGNPRLIQDLNVPFNSKDIEKETLEGKTPVILATREKVIGIAMVADTLKSESKEAIRKLRQLGVSIIMLTGDNKNTAQYIAKQVGIDEVVAEVLPEDKINKIKEFQAQGNIVAMVGDGINDAPALAQADVGIAMATGTDVAIESAGITLLHGDISKLVKAFKLSKITMVSIKQNLFWAFIYNIVGIPLASGVFYPFFGWLLSPVFAGFAMAFSSVSVVLNSLRLKRKKL